MVTLLKLNVTAFGGKVSQPFIMQRQYFILPLDLGDVEGKKLLSSYKRDPR